MSYQPAAAAASKSLLEEYAAELTPLPGELAGDIQLKATDDLDDVTA